MSITSQPKAARTSGVLTDSRRHLSQVGLGQGPHTAPARRRTIASEIPCCATTTLDPAREHTTATPLSAAEHLHPASSLGEANKQPPIFLVDHAAGRRERSSASFCL
ncbi:hypothetical protein [Pengzhenrongella phosphoraccumulans]|uniref:hypothetical protein n=1 Tax=Pengzhenrongella phosphoraccumulans TaxID=3114394 RepID=UPI003890C28C